MSIFNRLRHYACLAYKSNRSLKSSRISVGKKIYDGNCEVFGYVDCIDIHTRSFTCHGWLKTNQVSFFRETGEVLDLFLYERDDLEESAWGFSFNAGPLDSTFGVKHKDNSNDVINIIDIDGALSKDKCGLAMLKDYSFIVLCMKHMPAAIKYLMFKDPSDKQMLREFIFGSPDSVPSEKVKILREDIFGSGRLESVSEFHETSIIMPVYNGYDLLDEVISRVVEHTPEKIRFIIIDDDSPDERVFPLLKKWERKHPEIIQLFKNESNLGFIGTVNRGFSIAKSLSGHVVLLNSDALVPSKWLSRLLRPFEEEPKKIATATPMTNDGEIFNIPEICERVDLQPFQVDEIDSAAALILPDFMSTSAPTGVGFCMGVNRHFLGRVGDLDSIFGKGYGEEVDWCQRARELGGVHVAVENLFVEHRGGQSFGSEAKKALIKRNSNIILERYPAYDAEVQEYIAKDPLYSSRFILAMRYLSGRKVTVYMAHSMGGGAELYLKNRIERDVSNDAASIIIRVGGVERWKIELYFDGKQLSIFSNNKSDVLKMFSLVGGYHLVYSSCVGSHDALDDVDLLLNLCRESAIDLEVLFHDFFPISPSYTLLDSEGEYHGVPEIGSEDRAHQYGEKSLSLWQNRWHELLSESSCRVIVFSSNSAEIVVSAYPDIEKKVSVVPHRLHSDIPRIDVEKEASVIGVLGNIGYQKGAGLISKWSREYRDDNRFRVAVIGEFDRKYDVGDNVVIHGSYCLSNLQKIVEKYNIGCWVIPSVSPETFSYTTHECIATGMPVFSFDLGAQGDAVRERLGDEYILDNEDSNPLEQVFAVLENQ